MTTEEQLIIQFMESNPEAWYSRKEISRRAVSRAEFEANAQWAAAPLAALVSARVLETNPQGLYRIAGPDQSSIRGI
jgi:hypothetical protein